MHEADKVSFLDFIFEGPISLIWVSLRPPTFSSDLATEGLNEIYGSSLVP